MEYEMGFRNWRRSGGLNKGDGMSQEERQGRAQRGGGLHAVETHRGLLLRPAAMHGQVHS